jgi:hypothetical protein
VRICCNEKPRTKLCRNSRRVSQFDLVVEIVIPEEQKCHPKSYTKSMAGGDEGDTRCLSFLSNFFIEQCVSENRRAMRSRYASLVSISTITTNYRLCHHFRSLFSLFPLIILSILFLFVVLSMLLPFPIVSRQSTPNCFKTDEQNFSPDKQSPKITFRGGSSPYNNFP